MLKIKFQVVLWAVCKQKGKGEKRERQMIEKIKYKIQINFRQFQKCEKRRGEWLFDLFTYFHLGDLLCNQQYKIVAIIFALRIFFPLSNITYKLHFIGVYTDFHVNNIIGKERFLANFQCRNQIILGIKSYVNTFL